MLSNCGAGEDSQGSLGQQGKKVKITLVSLLAVLWLGLSLIAWVAPAKEMSEAERRPLDQMPELSLETLLSGKFMTDFESYTLDQFPARDAFRSLKSLFHSYALGQKDNNGIYIADGYAAKLEYPLNQASVNYAVNNLNGIYETYLKDSGSKVYMAVVPDKGTLSFRPV